MSMATAIRFRLVLGSSSGKDVAACTGRSLWTTTARTGRSKTMATTLNKNGIGIGAFSHLLNTSVSSFGAYRYHRHQSTQSTSNSNHDSNITTLTTPSSSSNTYKGALNKEDEVQEKNRVATLTPFEKEMELRDLDSYLERYNMLKRINTGELYTMRGQFKALVQDYGMPFMVWYWTVWSTTAVLTYGVIYIGNVDAMALLQWADGFTGYDISTKVDPTLGTIGLTIAINEMLEPIRLPLVVVTTKPIVKQLKERRII